MSCCVLVPQETEKAKEGKIFFTFNELSILLTVHIEVTVGQKLETLLVL